jgi:hypothetical protein
VDPRVTVLGGGENFIQNQNSKGFELYSNFDSSIKDPPELENFK